METRIQLEQQLKRLKMPGILHALHLRVAEAQQNRIGYLEFLSRLIDDETQSRENSMLAKRLKTAAFGVQQTFEQFGEVPRGGLRDLRRGAPLSSGKRWVTWRLSACTLRVSTQISFS